MSTPPTSKDSIKNKDILKKEINSIGETGNTSSQKISEAGGGGGYQVIDPTIIAKAVLYQAVTVAAVRHSLVRHSGISLCQLKWLY